MRSTPLLNQSAAWMGGTVPCSSIQPVVIVDQASFARYMGNAALRGATSLGQVVITWPEISTVQINAVLANKTSFSELAIENCGSITSLSPGIDAITTVTNQLIIDNVDRVRNLAFPALTSVGGSVLVLGSSSLRTVVAPLLGSTGGGVILRSLPQLRVMQFTALRSTGLDFSVYGASR